MNTNQEMEINFICACDNGDLDTVRECVETHGVNPDASETDELESGIELAILNDNDHIVDYLLSKGAAQNRLKELTRVARECKARKTVAVLLKYQRR